MFRNGGNGGGLRSAMTTTCACQPGRWEFTLDFSRTACGETNLLSPQLLQLQQQQQPTKQQTTNWNDNSLLGVNSVVCISSLRPAPKERDDNNNKPVVEEQQRHFFDHVERIHIREMGIYESEKNWLDRIFSKNGDLSTSLTLRGKYHDGDSFTYTSVVMANPRNNNHGSQHRKETSFALPTGLQVHLIGKNQANQPAEFDFTLHFYNDCHVYPIVSAGHYMGPVTVTQVAAPSHDVCPLVDSFN